jgi:hypothetical protein
MKLTVLTYNTLFAGYDGTDDRRAKTQVGLINELSPDVFLMQEAKGFDADGNARLFALESKISMRGFLAIAPRTGQNLAIFIRAPLRAVGFEADGAHFHHATATLRVALPNSEKQVSFISAHPRQTGRRRHELESGHAHSHHRHILRNRWHRFHAQRMGLAQGCCDQASDVPCAIRRRDRVVVALLLPGVAARAGVTRCAD